MSKEDSAYPWSDQGQPMEYGLTKRELFAAMAMQAIYPSVMTPQGAKQMAEQIKETGRFVEQVIAESAVRQADALLAELEKD